MELKRVLICVALMALVKRMRWTRQQKRQQRRQMER